MELRQERFEERLQLAEHFHPTPKDQEDIEAKKQAAIALCKRRIQAAIDLYGDGRISRPEYLRRVEQNEREVMAWRAKTSDRENLAME